MYLLFKNVVKKQYYSLNFIITSLLLLLIAVSSTLDLTAIAQEELEILVNEDDEVISETGEDVLLLMIIKMKISQLNSIQQHHHLNLNLITFGIIL